MQIAEVSLADVSAEAPGKRAKLEGKRRKKESLALIIYNFEGKKHKN